MSIAEYFEWYILYIPFAVYGWGLGAFLLVLVTVLLWKGIKEGFRYGTAFLLVEYVALLLYFTVFIRREAGYHEYALMPFWTYSEIFSGTRVLAQEILMNIAVFIPIGFMSALVLKSATLKSIALIGMTISLVVELLQLALERGCCETDDVMHNTLGCVAGYGLFSLLRRLFVTAA